jgi:hypothetical protein
MSCSKSNLFSVYYSVINRHSSLVDPIIKAICSFRLRRSSATSIDHSNKPVSNSYQIHVDFNNPSLDSIWFNKIFRIPDTLARSIPEQEKDALRPTVRFRYETPIGPQLYNYKHASTVLAKLPYNHWAKLCRCNQFRTVDAHHKHLISGDLDIIEDLDCRKLLRNGPKFRCPKRFDATIAKENVMNGIKGYIVCRQRRNYNMIPWSEVQDAWMNNIDAEFDRIDGNSYIQTGTEDWDNYMHRSKLLASDVIITTIDKATQNFSFVCKFLYLNTIRRLLEDSTPNPTYVRTPYTILEATKMIRDACWNQFQIRTPTEASLPFIHIIPKFHKSPVDFRTIIASKSAVTKNISVLVSNALKLVQSNLRKYCNKMYQTSGVNAFWIIDNHDPILANISGLSKDKLAKSVQTYDFGQMYTNLKHDDILNAMYHVLSIVFNRIEHMWVTSFRASFREVDRPDAFKIDKTILLQMIAFVIDHSLFQFGNNVFKQVIGIPMGSSCAPFLANLTLFSYEFKFVTSSLKAGQISLCKSLNATYRYIDDITVINYNDCFNHLAANIYPTSLILKKMNATDSSADVLDISIRTVNHKFITDLFDKRSTFPFHCNTFPAASSLIPRKCFINVIINELARYISVCSTFEAFRENACRLLVILCNKGYPYSLLDDACHRFGSKFTQSLLFKYHVTRNSCLSKLQSAYAYPRNRQPIYAHSVP